MRKRSENFSEKIGIKKLDELIEEIIVREELDHNVIALIVDQDFFFLTTIGENNRLFYRTKVAMLVR